MDAKLAPIYYALYIPITLLLTFLVGRVLFRHGRRFLVDITAGDESLADSINMLLLTGFYLVNIGYMLFMAIYHGYLGSYRELMETLVEKIGTITLMLGVVHYANIVILYRLRKRIRQEAEIREQFNLQA